MRPPAPSDATVSASALRSLAYFVGERQRVWHRRHVLRRERPWTTDAILAERHFTNVMRDLDPGTAYVVEALRGRDRADAIFGAVAYRGLNRRATFVDAELGVPTRAQRAAWLRYLDERRARGERVVIGRHRTPSRADYAAALTRVAEWAPTLPRASRAALVTLRALRGFGPFLAWQVTQDLAATRHLEPDPDLVLVSQGSAFAVFVLAGLLRPTADYRMPGTYARPGDQRRVRPSETEEESFNAWARWLRDVQGDWLPSDWPEVAPGPLSVGDVEHALCEWGRWVVAWHERRAGRRPSLDGGNDV